MIKATTPLLVTSVAANIALAGIIFFRAAAGGDSSERDTSPATAQSAQTAASTLADRMDQTTPTSEIWSAFRAGSDADFVARLRAAGFPTSLVNLIVRTEISQRFADRQREIERLKDKQPWWRVGVDSIGFQPEVRSATRALERDIDAVMEQLVGPDIDIATERDRADLRRQFGNLPPEKVRRLRNIISDYSDLESAVSAEARGVILPEDRAKLALLAEEKRKDMAAALTPEELADYDLRSSPTASQLQRRLWAFEPSEEEYRALFSLQQQLDRRFGSPNVPLNREQAEQRRVAEAELTTQIAALLGPERFAEYRITTDPGYSPVWFALDRNGLPTTLARDVVGTQLDITDRARVLKADASLSSEARRAQLAALAQEATQRLTALLGENVFADFRKGAGRWVDQIQVKP